MLEALQYTFFRNALIAGALVSIACGIIGTLIIVNRLVFLSGGIAHAAYGGIGIAYFLNQNPVIGAVIFSLLSALGMGYVQRNTKERSDTVIGVMWAVGMALGIVFLDLSPGYKADLMSYLFGSILAVPSGDLMFMIVLDILILLIVALLYKEIVAVSFDEEFATVENVPVSTIFFILFGLIALTVVITMRLVGLIMVIALLTIPPAIAGIFYKDMKKMMVAAVLLGMLFTTCGLFLSYSFNLTSGATIILTSGTAYGIAQIGKAIHDKRALQP
ncbi:MAG: metal ABC transporter permease [Chloroflexi bacterium]|nr:metal ABC transporter permease [Chloroflexota bacterium]